MLFEGFIFCFLFVCFFFQKVIYLGILFYVLMQPWNQQNVNFSCQNLEIANTSFYQYFKKTFIYLLGCSKLTTGPLEQGAKYIQS